MFALIGSHVNENFRKNEKKEKNFWAYGPGEATTKIWKKSME